MQQAVRRTSVTKWHMWVPERTRQCTRVRPGGATEHHSVWLRQAQYLLCMPLYTSTCVCRASFKVSASGNAEELGTFDIKAATGARWHPQGIIMASSRLGRCLRKTGQPRHDLRPTDQHHHCQRCRCCWQSPCARASELIVSACDICQADVNGQSLG